MKSKRDRRTQNAPPLSRGRVIRRGPLVLVYREERPKFSGKELKDAKWETWNPGEQVNWWKESFHPENRTDIKKLMGKLSSYQKRGLNAGGINETLLNIRVHYEQGKEVSASKDLLKKIRGHIEKAIKFSRQLPADPEMDGFPEVLSPALCWVVDRQSRTTFIESRLVQRKDSQKKPTLIEAQRLECQLLSYFVQSGYCKSLDGAKEELIGLLEPIGVKIKFRHLTDIWKDLRKNTANTDPFDIQYYGLILKKNK